MFVAKSRDVTASCDISEMDCSNDAKPAEMAAGWGNTAAQQTIRSGQGSIIYYDNYGLTIGVNYWEKIPTSESNSSYSSDIYSYEYCGYDKDEQLTLDDIVVEE